LSPTIPPLPLPPVPAPPSITITLTPAAPDPSAMWSAIGIWAGDAIAFLALGAAGAAAWAAYQQLKTLRIENRRRQAAGVTAWIDGTREPLVLNSSTSPVYNAVVLTETAGRVYRFPVLPPMTQPIRADRGDVVVSCPLDPGAEQPVATHQPEASQARSKPRPIAYMDAAGVHWQRDESGTLTEVDGHPWDPFDQHPSPSAASEQTATTSNPSTTLSGRSRSPWRPQWTKRSQATGTEATVTQSSAGVDDDSTA
jgi:hypothetical protein